MERCRSKGVFCAREDDVSSLVDVGAFWAMIDEIKVCILVTRHGEALRGRPMGPVANRALGEIHFPKARTAPTSPSSG